jgi:beta-galactosidase
MAEHSALASPVRLAAGDSLGDSARRLVLENRQDVRDLAWLRAQWRLAADGGGSRRGEPTVLTEARPADLPALAAGASGPIDVPEDLLRAYQAEADPDAEAWLVLDVVAATATPRGPEGAHLVSLPVPLAAERRDLALRAADERATATGTVVDDEGLLAHPLLAAAPRLALWRAPTDNDRIGGFAARWAELGLDRLERRLVSVDDRDAAVVVTADVVTGAGHVVRHLQTLTPLGAGVHVEEWVVLPPELTDVPRVGTVFEIGRDVAADVVQWFGGGPFESYPDRRAAAVVGFHRRDLDDLFTPYVRPQESGGLDGVRWFAVGAGAGAREDAPAAGAPRGAAQPSQPRQPSNPWQPMQPSQPWRPGLVVHLDVPRQVSLTRYRVQDLATATHSTELVPRADVVVHLDAAHRGLGTASCGPDTLPRYLVGPGEYRWSYTLTTPTE